jgi:hypothetical protein
MLHLSKIIEAQGTVVRAKDVEMKELLVKLSSMKSELKSLKKDR